MCGRYALNRLSASDVSWSYPFVRPVRFDHEERFHGRYNIAPRTYAPVIRQDRESTGVDVILQAMRWGVVPHFIKHEEKTLRTINARGEHLVDGTSGLWNSLRGRNRCVVPVQGYYEWLTKGNKDKIPYFSKYKDDRLMLLAGLWDVATIEGSTEPLYTFAIVTTDSSKQLSFLHDRMPVVISSELDINLWLGSSDWSNSIARLIKPCEEVTFDCYPVPTEVGKVGSEDPSFIRPVSERRDGIEAMLKKKQIQSSNTSLAPERNKSISDLVAHKPSPSAPSHSGKREETDSGNVVESSDSQTDHAGHTRHPSSPPTVFTKGPQSPSKIESPTVSPRKKRKNGPAVSEVPKSPSKKHKKEDTSVVGPGSITHFFKSKSSQ